jgi:adenylyltransferase/sulfurtransferase
LRQADGSYSANLRDAFPEMNTDVPNCEEAGTLNAIVGMIATAQVNEVLKIITGIGIPLTNELLLYNSLENRQFKMKLTANTSEEDIAKLFQLHTYFDAACAGEGSDLQLTPSALKEMLSDPKQSAQIELIAVLPNLKLPFKVHQTIPIEDFDASRVSLDSQKTYVMVCQRGLNSYKAAKQLKEKYPNAKVLNLMGGISSY